MYERMEHIESTGTQYIDTGCNQSGEPIAQQGIPVCGCRFYDGEELIKDYKPCKNAESVEGMYDVITEEFLDRDSFEKMMLEHYMRSDKITVSIGGGRDG